MKLSSILENLNSLEKNSFIKIIDSIISDNPRNAKQIEKLLASSENAGLKNLDNSLIANIFHSVENEFTALVKAEFVNTSTQLDVLTDLLIRDGNCLMKHDWFAQLYDREIKELKKKTDLLAKDLTNMASENADIRIKEYDIYKSCVQVAFTNDVSNNRETKITDDELSILIMLAKKLGLSQEEVKLINYSVLGIVKRDIDDIINELKNIGVLFYSKKLNTVFIPDEVVKVLRNIRGKEVADKYLRRVLTAIKDPQINLACRKHGIDWKQDRESKIKDLVNSGISLTSLLGDDIHKSDTNLSQKKNWLNEFWSKSLGREDNLKGVTLEDKLTNIISFFDELENDEKVSISFEGFEKLLRDLNETLPEANQIIKNEFQLQENDVLKGSLLLNYNLKPRDILEIIPSKSIDTFCAGQNIKSRGSIIDNILDHYKDSENLMLENYISIAYRDLKVLKENGIDLKEAELGVKFEELTKSIFTQLGFNVDEELRKKLNTKKDQIDIVLNLGDGNLIVVECKTSKESGYNKFSSVSRQLKAYADLVKNSGLVTTKTLLVAPEFSEDFISDTELEYQLNLSLITAESLLNILQAFKDAKKHDKFPYKLLMRDVLIKEDRIIKAISK